MFWLLTLGAYGRYVQRSVQGQALGWTSRNYWLALLFFTLGLMSKPMLVTLPFVLLLLDYWPLNRVSSCRFQAPDGETAVETRSVHYQLPTDWHLVWEKIPFFMLSAISCVVTLLAQSKGVIPVAGLPISVRIENALVSYARYLGKTFWPVDLAIPYPYPGEWPSTDVILAVVLLIAICAVAVWWRRRLPFLFVGWFWFLGTLVPVIGLVQVGLQPMADRYTYVPLIGIFIILVWGAEKAVARRHLPKLAAGIAGVLVLGICSMLTRHQLEHWQNTETLFRHTIAATESNVFAYDNLGYYLYQHGHPEEAFENYRRALSVDPKDYMAYNNIGCYFFGRGRLDEAVTNCQQALRLNPNDPNTLNNLGMVLACQKKYSEAIKCYEAALRLVPDYADAHNNLGAALNAVGRTDEAIWHYDQAMRLVPNNAKAHNNLGNTLIAKGRVEEAIEHYRQAIKLNPDFVEALNNLALVLTVTKQYAEASLYYQRALRLDPDNPKTHFFLGCVLVQSGRREEAVVQLEEALRLKPDYAEAKRELQMLKVTVTE
jgi:protein O-mannosyl-transferase